MITTRTVRTLLCIAAVLGFSASSHAQTAPRAEFSAGWRLLNIPDAVGTESETLPLGWYADVAGNLTPMFAVVGEVGGNYKNFNDVLAELGANVNVDVNVNVHTFMGGVRFSARQNPAFTPYVQALFGLAHAKTDVEGQVTVAGRTISLNESMSDSEFAFDADGGVNIRLSDALAVRVGAGYLRVGTSDGGNAFRFSAGVVIPF
jgi:outer membrane protein with beta-barrel domain